MDFLLDITVARAVHADRLRQADAARRALAAARPSQALDQSVLGRWPPATTLLAILAGVWSLITATPPRTQ
jgi:hypothetical protein